MAQVVLSNAMRFSVHGHVNGHAWTNIWDFLVAGPTTRPTAAAQKARLMLDTYADHIMPGVSAGTTVDRCSWVDLDSIDGETGEENDTSANNFPHAGSIIGDELPGNCAVLVRKITRGGRRYRNGRMYLPGVAESQTDGNLLLAAPLSNLQNALNTVFNVVNAPLPAGDTCILGVIGQAGGTPAVFNNVSSLQAEQLIATQRRRLRTHSGS